MQIEFTMGPDFPRTARQLSEAGKALLAGCSEGLREGVEYAADHVAENYLSDQALRSRSGSLRRAMGGWLAGPLHGVVGVRPGAAVDAYKWLLGDEQKTITPQRSKFLTIPIGENLRPSGVPQYSSPRQVPDGFFVRSKGRLLFGYKRGKKGKFRALFVLVKSVFVQGTGALYDGVEETLDDIAESMEEKGRKAIDHNA